jgi:hypothetical protein
MTNQEDVRCVAYLEKDPIQRKRHSRKILLRYKRNRIRKIQQLMVNIVSHALRGDKVYEAGDCPVCGMDLVKAPKISVEKPFILDAEVIQDAPGSYPICGMDLVPIEP